MRTDKPLADKTAIITGGSGSIAEGSALCLLRDGADVVLVARQEAPLAQSRDRLLAQVPDGEVAIIPGDCLDETVLQQAMAHAHGLHDRLDIIVATVGQGELRPIMVHDAASFRCDWERNVISAFLAVRYGAPYLPRGGAITCISSIVANLPTRWMSAYATAKGGLESFIRTAAEELAPAGIRVNAVRPGLTRSRLRGGIFNDPPMLDRMLAEIPLGRGGEPADIGEAVRFLSGPEASWITGQSLAVDGGNLLRKNADLREYAAATYGEEMMQRIEDGDLSQFR